MTGKIPQPFIDELLSRVDIVALIHQRVPLKKAGREYQACCPFHHEKTPSFTVSPTKQFYHCFGCGAHGTAIGFLMEYERLSFSEAIEELATQQGLTIPRDMPFNQGTDHKPLYQLLAQAVNYYAQQLRQHQAAHRAVDYLKARGLDGQTAAAFRLGFAPPGKNNLIQFFGKNTSMELMSEAGLVKATEGQYYDRLRDRIIFPIRDGRGRVIGFGGRLLNDGKPKYLNSPETPIFHKSQALYGLYEARQTHRQLENILVVEGYMDVVALAQFNIRNVVATLGTATTTEHIRTLYRTCQQIIFCFDGDRAGQDAAWKALQTVLPQIKEGRQARFLFLPDGEDPDSLVRRIGPDAFQDKINQAQPLSEFLFDKLESQVDTNHIDGLAQLAELAKPLISKLPESTFRAMVKKQLDERIGLTTQIPAAPPEIQRPTIRRPPQNTRTMPPLRRAVALVLQYPEIAQHSLPDHWQTLNMPGIDTLSTLIHQARQNPQTTTASLVEQEPDPKLRQHLARLAVTEITVQDDAAEQLRHILNGLLAKNQREQREQLVQKNQPPSQMSEAEKQRLREMYQ